MKNCRTISIVAALGLAGCVDDKSTSRVAQLEGQIAALQQRLPLYQFHYAGKEMFPNQIAVYRYGLADGSIVRFAYDEVKDSPTIPAHNFLHSLSLTTGEATEAIDSLNRPLLALRAEREELKKSKASAKKQVP